MASKSLFQRPKGPWLTALALGALGALLALGGARLIMLGGAWYYAIAGAALVAVSWRLWRGDAWGAHLYWIVLALTWIWAVAEAGLTPWSLLPRVLAPSLIGVWLAMPWVSRKLDFARPPKPAASAKPPRDARFIGVCAAVGLGLAACVAVLPFASLHAPNPSVAPGTPSQWSQVGRTLSGTRFAPDAQITPRNVSLLQRAWTFHTGETAGSFEATPLYVGDTLYVCTAHNTLIALDPEIGVERWRYVSNADPHLRMFPVCRGVAYHDTPTANGPCASRLLMATIDARLIAIDARSGALCEGFGENGAVSLLDGIGAAPEGHYYVTSPPTIVGDIAVLGAFVMDNQSTASPSGVVRAFDVHSGQLVWAWDMGAPQRTGAPPEGEIYTPGTPNVWSIMSADPDLGLVYLPMGNPTPDFWGGARRDFDEEFGSAVVALDIETGRPRWHFQTTHHDLWDYDLPAQPILADIPTPQGERAALIQLTKHGEVFILDRATGEPIFPVYERPVPSGAAAGDWSAPTQPFSSVSLAPPDLRERDMWGLTPLDQLMCRIRFLEARYEGRFTLPGVTPSVKYPGAFGVIDWGGGGVDERRDILIVNTSGIPYIDRLLPRETAPDFVRQITDMRSYEWGPQENTPFAVNTHPFLSRLGVPCSAPPWGRLNAIDLTTGHLLWSRALGTARDNGPFYRPSGLPFTIGAPNIGGAIATETGLTFVAATTDHYLRAFDTETGRELWRGRLPASGHATPMTFTTQDGAQFVVIAAGGHGSMGPRLSDALVAFRLAAPDASAAAR